MKEILSNNSYTLKHSTIAKGKVLIRKLYGRIDIPGIISTWQEDIKNNVVTNELEGIITDFSHCTNLATLTDLPLITSFYLEHIELFKNKKLGVVLDSPNVAILMLFEIENEQFRHKAFTTSEAALEWMFID